MTRWLIAFIIGLFVKKAVENKEMEKLFYNIAQYGFDTIKLERK